MTAGVTSTVLSTRVMFGADTVTVWSPRGDEPERPGEGMGTRVGRGEHVGDAGVERIEGIPGRGRGRVAAVMYRAAEAGGEVPVGVDGGHGHRQDRAGRRGGRGGDAEGDGPGQVG